MDRPDEERPPEAVELLVRPTSNNSNSGGNLHERIYRASRQNTPELPRDPTAEGVEGLTEAEIAQANMQQELLQQGQRLVFWFGTLAQVITLGVGWGGWAVWHNQTCDKPLATLLLIQLCSTSCSLVINVIFRIIQVRDEETYNKYSVWKRYWERFSSLLLFSIFVAVMVFFAVSKKCDKGIKYFTFWYFLTIVILFPCALCCGAFALIIALVVTRRIGSVAQRIDGEVVEDQMEQLDFEKLDEAEKCKDCAICHESYGDEPEKPIVRLFCGHIFHKECVKEWLVQYSDTCPICRAHQRDFINRDDENQDENAENGENNNENDPESGDGTRRATGSSGATQGEDAVVRVASP